MRHLSSLCVLMLGVMASMVGVSRAAPLDDRIPQDAIAYAGWAGSDALAPEYAKSNLKAIIDASSISKYLKTQLPGLIEMAGRTDPEAPKIIEKLQTGLGLVWRHPCAFYFCPIDMTTPQNPGFRFGLICDAGADTQALAGMINEQLAKNPPPPTIPLHVSTDGTFVMMTFGAVDSMADLQKGGTLSKSPAYLKAMAQVQQNGQAMAAYLDMEKLRAMILDLLDKGVDVPPEVKLKAGTVIAALGLDKLTQAAFVSGFDGKAWSDRSFVGVGSPRSGLLATLGSSPLSDTILTAVPKDAAMFSAGKFDLHALFVGLRNAVGTFAGDRGLQDFDAQVAQAGQMVQMDIEKDLLASLGDEWILYRAPGGEDAGMSSVLANKLRDGDAFAKALASLETFFNEHSGSPIKVEKVAVGKMQVSAIMMLQYNVVWTVQNGYLYVSDLAGIEGAIAQVEGKKPSILESDAYKAVMADMPKGIKPTSISFSQPARLYPQIRNLALGVLPLIRGQGIDIPMDLLPTPASVAEYMTPGGDVTWSDADGFHAVSRTAFPGAAVMGGQNGGAGTVAIVAMGTAVLLPSLGRAREIASRTTDTSNLKTLAIGCEVYAADNADKFPDSFAVLLMRGDISPKNLVSKRAGTPPLEMTEEMQKLGKEDFAKFSTEVYKHCDYVYLGKGLKTEISSALVLAYEKPGPAAIDGINIAYQDGHVEFTRWPMVAQSFIATNDYLAKHNLPLVDIDTLGPTGGPPGGPVMLNPPRPSAPPLP